MTKVNTAENTTISTNNETVELAKSKKPAANIPPRIRISIQNGNKNFERVKERLANLNLKDYNDVVALENIIRVLDANEKVKDERNQKRRSSRDGSTKIDSTYAVIFANDTLSKNLIGLTRRVNTLNDTELKNIQESFLRNNIDDVMISLDSSKNLISDTREIISVLAKTFNSKDKNSKYQKGNILEEIKKVFLETSKEPEDKKDIA